MTVFTCETGNNLTVLRKLGLLCFAFFLQTVHSCNLFAAFVALLHKPRETSAKQKKPAGQLVRPDTAWTEMHESEREFGKIWTVLT